MSEALDYVMIRIEDLEESLDQYTTHLGYGEKGRWEADTFTNVYLGPKNLHEEGVVLGLAYNHDDNTCEMGGTWGHIAVRISKGKLESSYRRLMDEDVEGYRGPELCGGRHAFARDPDSHGVEVVGRDHGARWDLDHTTIRVKDAGGALGFWTRKLGYGRIGRWESDIFANYSMRPEDAAEETTAVELIYNYNGRNCEMGDAWGHPAVGTDDLHNYWKTFTKCEAEGYCDPESYDDMLAFMKDPDSHEIEVVPANLESLE